MRGSLVPLRAKSWLPKTGHFPVLHRFEEEMENLMERFFGEDGGWLTTEGFTPTTDVVETEDAFEVTVDLPGLKPDEVHVELKDGGLWISGEREEENEEKEKMYHRIERRHGQFRRVLPLPSAIDEEKVEAKFERGVLKITVPKTEEVKPKHIPVRA